MGYNKLKEQFKTGDFSKCFHFYGEEAYLKNHYLNELSGRLVGDGSEFDMIKFESDAFTGDEIMGAVYTPPLTGDAKLLLLKETGLFKAGAGGREIWKNVFSDLPPWTYIIAYEDSFDRRNAAYKAFAKVCLSVDFKPRSRGDIRAWVGKMLSRDKINISSTDMEYLLDMTGVDMYNVSTQVKSLVSAAARKKEITREDIDSLVSETLFTKEYLWTDAVLSGHNQKAMSALNELFEMRREPVMLLYILSSSVLSTYRAKLLLEEGAAVTAKSLGVPQEFLAKKFAGFARGLDSEYLKGAISLLKEADYDLKSGRTEPKTGIITLCAEILSQNRKN